jgi:hypothetical protein
MTGNCLGRRLGMGYLLDYTTPIVVVLHSQTLDERA